MKLWIFGVHLRSKLYDLYLKSPEWKAISDECKRLANFKCNRCDNTTNLHAHHLTYDNIGEEKQEDLECLCLSCHEIEHGKSFGVKDLPYLKVGNGKTGRYGESMNLIQEMAKMTKPEQVMFALLEKGLDYWDERSINKVKLNMDELSSTEKQYIKRAYPLLEGKGIIIRVSRGVYQINPRLILAKDSVGAMIEWDKKCNPKFKIRKS